MEHIYDYTIKLIRYVLNGDVPQLPETIDFEKLYAFGKSHGVENMLYVGLRDLNIDVPAETMQKFRTAYEMQIMVEATQALELEAIGDAFEKAGIDYIPLKGSVIKYLYPMPDYRKSGDIDILVRREKEEKADAVLTNELGYIRSDHFEGYEVHISYDKKPFLEVEIHRQILKSTNRAYKLFKNIWKLITPKEAGSHQYIMHNELMYTYMLAHLCNHLYEGGAGIRMFLDFYVMRQKLSCDEVLLNKYLKRANLVDINNIVTNTINKWCFDNYEYNKDVELLEKIVFSGGSFGTREMHNKIHDSNTFMGKLRQLKQKLFMPKSRLLQYNPEYGEGTNLVIVIYFRRIKSILLNRRKEIFTETKKIMGSNKRDDDLTNIVKAICDR